MSRYISEALRSKIRKLSANRCAYCLTRQEYIPWPLEIEHIVPFSKGGTNDEENLCLACRSCNSFKGNQTQAYDPLTNHWVPLYNPRRQSWKNHFQWSDDGTIIVGHTSCGRATVAALKLNNEIAITVRRNWVSVDWHPPKD